MDATHGLAAIFETRAPDSASALPGERAPQDEVGDLFYAPLSRMTTFVRGFAATTPLSL
jgi:hypothetical protein